MIQKGANLNIIYGENHLSVLHIAAKVGNLDMVKLLVQNGASVFSKGLKGETPLHFAVLNGNKEVIEFLIDSGSDIEARDSDNMTPLGLALYKSDYDENNFKIKQENLIKEEYDESYFWDIEDSHDRYDESSQTALKILLQKGACFSCIAVESCKDNDRILLKIAEFIKKSFFFNIIYNDENDQIINIINQQEDLQEFVSEMIIGYLIRQSIQSEFFLKDFCFLYANIDRVETIKNPVKQELRLENSFDPSYSLMDLISEVGSKNILLNNLNKLPISVQNKVLKNFLNLKKQGMTLLKEIEDELLIKQTEVKKYTNLSNDASIKLFSDLQEIVKIYKQNSFSGEVGSVFSPLCKSNNCVGVMYDINYHIINNPDIYHKILDLNNKVIVGGYTKKFLKEVIARHEDYTTNKPALLILCKKHNQLIEKFSVFEDKVKSTTKENVELNRENVELKKLLTEREIEIHKTQFAKISDMLKDNMGQSDKSDELESKNLDNHEPWSDSPACLQNSCNLIGNEGFVAENDGDGLS